MADILVYDIETTALAPSEGRIKRVGFWSYKYNKYVALSNPQKIINYINEHDVLVGYNHIEFDNMWVEAYCGKIKVKQNVDMLEVMRKRAPNMKVKFKSFSLKNVCDTLGMGAKGDIDLSVLMAETNTPEEKVEIDKYLKQDVFLTKKLFEYMDKEFKTLLEFLPKSEKAKYGHLLLSSGSYAYKAVCHMSEIEEKYDFNAGFKEQNYEGGYVALPTVESCKGKIYCLDFASAYPHAFMMQNLYSISDNIKNSYNGNGLYKLSGAYKTDKMGEIEKTIKKLYALRQQYKTENDPREYAVKILINCFDKDTEIVTVNGIKKIMNCVEGELVYSINPKTQQLETKPILEVTKRKHTGEMHRYKSLFYDFKVTPEHKMLLRKLSKTVKINPVEFIQSKNTASSYTIPKQVYYKEQDNIKIGLGEFYDNLNIIIKPHYHGTTWKYDNGLQNTKSIYRQNDRTLQYDYNIIKEKIETLQDCDIYCKDKDRYKEHKIPYFYDLNDLIELFGWFVSEGSLDTVSYKTYDNGNIRGISYRCCISQYKNHNPEFHNDINMLLSKMNLKYSYNDKCFVISNKIIQEIIKKKCGQGSFNQHIGFFDIMGTEQHNILYETLQKGDGTKKSSLYTTASNALKDDFIKLLLLLGRTPIVRNDGCWRIYNTENENSLRKQNKTIYQYDDYIYNVCVADNHTILAGSNGKFNWIGQTIYGISGAPKFSSVYNINTASDCTLSVREWLKYARKVFIEKGYNVLYSDTDSVYLEDIFGDEEKMLSIKDEIITYIKASVPFPQKTFDMTVDERIKAMWFFKDKNGKFKKKHYAYITKENKLKVKGIAIVKSNSSELSKLIVKQLSNQMLDNCDIKITKDVIDRMMREEIEKDISIIQTEYKVHDANDYKSKTCIQMDILNKYGPGTHHLIRNKRIGVGKGVKYCTIKEAKNFSYNDLDLSRIWNELDPFIKKSQVTLW